MGGGKAKDKDFTSFTRVASLYCSLTVESLLNEVRMREEALSAAGNRTDGRNASFYSKRQRRSRAGIGHTVYHQSHLRRNVIGKPENGVPHPLFRTVPQVDHDGILSGEYAASDLHCKQTPEIGRVQFLEYGFPLVTKFQEHHQKNQGSDHA
jgi:hypothetical protein